MSVPLPTVLVVDDERFFRDAIRDALREAGFACRAVAGADEALAALDDPARRRRGARPAAARRRTGRAPCARCASGTRPLRVIVLATHADQEDVLEALRQGRERLPREAAPRGGAGARRAPGGGSVRARGAARDAARARARARAAHGGARGAGRGAPAPTSARRGSAARSPRRSPSVLGAGGPR